MSGVFSGPVSVPVPVPVPGPVAVVPGVLALLPEYASLVDPVADLRAACLEAVAGLGPRVTVVSGSGFGSGSGSGAGARVGRALVAAAGLTVVEVGSGLGSGIEADGVLVVGNGSAKRTEKAPGHFDPRTEAFDAAIATGLRAGRVAVDAAVAEELWADVGAFAVLEGLVGERAPEVLYEDAPFGVAYWVMRWR